ncbi:hypothetical protein D3C76_1161240 [compost metagenome]
MIAQLPPGPHFEQFLQRTQPSRQGNEGIAQLGHAGLARMHAIHHFQAGQALVADFSVQQALRDDPDHFSTGRHGRVGHHAHQADRATAIHQGQATAGNGLA